MAGQAGQTLYVRGWEVTTFADKEGMLNVEVQKGSGNEIFEVEPLESGVPLSSPRDLAAWGRRD